MNLDLPTLMSGLGINPDTVVKDSVRIEFRTDFPVLTYTAILGVPPDLLSRALIAAIPQPEAQPEAVETAEAVTDQIVEEEQ